MSVLTATWKLTITNASRRPFQYNQPRHLPSLQVASPPTGNRSGPIRATAGRMLKSAVLTTKQVQHRQSLSRNKIALNHLHLWLAIRAFTFQKESRGLICVRESKIASILSQRLAKATPPASCAFPSFHSTLSCFGYASSTWTECYKSQHSWRYENYKKPTQFLTRSVIEYYTPEKLTKYPVLVAWNTIIPPDQSYLLAINHQFEKNYQ